MAHGVGDVNGAVPRDGHPVGAIQPGEREFGRGRGVGGLAGFNRTMKVDPLRDGIKNHTLDSIMFPPDLWNSSPGAASIGWNDSQTRYGASPVSTTEKKSCE